MATAFSLDFLIKLLFSFTLIPSICPSAIRENHVDVGQTLNTLVYKDSVEFSETKPLELPVKNDEPLQPETHVPPLPAFAEALPNQFTSVEDETENESFDTLSRQQPSARNGGISTLIKEAQMDIDENGLVSIIKDDSKSTDEKSPDILKILTSDAVRNPPTIHIRLKRAPNENGTNITTNAEGKQFRRVKKRRKKIKGKGAYAHSKSKTGKVTANAISKDGDTRAIATNGTSAGALAVSGKEGDGSAEAIADTYGEGGARSNALTRGKGDASSISKSRGTGNSSSTAYAGGGGDATADSQAKNGGDAASKAYTTGSGEAMSNSQSRKGGAESASISAGEGGAKSNSYAGGETGDAKSLATSKGGNVIANSKAAGKGDSYSSADTIGSGDAISNALAKEGVSRADAVSEDGDSAANAINGSVEYYYDDDEDIDFPVPPTPPSMENSKTHMA